MGLAAGNEMPAVLFRALLVMTGCLIIGTIIGKVLQRTVDLHIEQHKQQNPIPGEDHGDPSKPQRTTAPTDGATPAT